MQNNAMRFGQLCDFSYGLNRSDLVVGVHDGNQNGFRADGCLHVSRSHQAFRADRQIGYFKAPARQVPANFKYSRVLEAGGDNVVALFVQTPGHAQEGVVVGFRAATGEDHL